MNNKERLEKFKDIAYEVYDDYGWIPDVNFNDETKLEEYKENYIHEFIDHFYKNTEHINENKSVVSRISNV